MFVKYWFPSTMGLECSWRPFCFATLIHAALAAAKVLLCVPASSADLGPALGAGSCDGRSWDHTPSSWLHKLALLWRLSDGLNALSQCCHCGNTTALLEKTDGRSFFCAEANDKVEASVQVHVGSSQWSTDQSIWCYSFSCQKCKCDRPLISGDSCLSCSLIPSIPPLVNGFLVHIHRLLQYLLELLSWSDPHSVVYTTSGTFQTPSTGGPTRTQKDIGVCSLSCYKSGPSGPVFAATVQHD